MGELVSAEWLRQNLNNKDLILLDSSLESTMNGSASSHSSKTISGARYFDLKGRFSDKESIYPNTLPTTAQFENECQKLGINKTSKIIVFDNLGIYSSPRVWWLFKIMGHNHVSVLNGGLPEWIDKGFAVDNRVTEIYEVGDFEAIFQKQFVKTYEEVLENISVKSFNIIDVRSEGRFNGVEQEPRKYLKSGHIANSINIHYKDVLDRETFKSEEELKSIFDEKCSNAENLVFSCGSGLTACIVMLACEIAHQKSGCIYDGSWTEWAERQKLIF